MSGPRHTSPSLDSFLAAVIDKPDRAGAAAFAAVIVDEDDSASVGAACDEREAASAAFAAAILREYDPDQPRDERGRWTAAGSDGGSADATERPRKMEQKDLDGMVDKLKASKEGEALFGKAEKAAKDAGAKGLTIKVEPQENLPDDSEAASNPKTGGIGIRDDLSDAKMLESLLVELGNITRSKELNDLQTNGVKKMTRDDYIEAMERLEFQSVQDTAKVWKSAAKGCGQDPSKCPSYGNPDDVLKLDFKTYFSRLSQSHKEGYGKQWDAAN